MGLHSCAAASQPLSSHYFHIRMCLHMMKGLGYMEPYASYPALSTFPAGTRMEEALELRAAARKRASKATSVFGKLGNSAKRAQAQKDAEEMFTKAGNMFMDLREFVEGANCFQSGSKLANDVYTKAALDIEAAKAWRQGNEPEMAAQCYAKAIATFATRGPQRRAALVCSDLAGMYEELGQFEYALKSWNRAVLLYESQHETAAAAQARIGAANVAVQAAKVPADYAVAIENFEKAAQDCAEDVKGVHSERYKLKKYFLKSGLCYLAAGDLIGIKEAISNKYTRWDRAFTGTLEFRLLKELVIAFEQHNVAKFEQAMFAYDSKQRLDKWHLDLALKAKQQVNKQPQDELL